MTKREVLFLLIGFQVAILILFLAYKAKVGVFNPSRQHHYHEVSNG